MPRLSKKFKLEMAFFINPLTGRVTYNKKCKGCLGDCKQSYKAEIIICRNYQKRNKSTRNDMDAYKVYLLLDATFPKGTSSMSSRISLSAQENYLTR